MPQGDLFSTDSPAAGSLQPDGPSSTPPAPQPLAVRMRPRTLEEFIGQSHLLGPGQLLRRAIEADRIQSLIHLGLRERKHVFW